MEVRRSRLGRNQLVPQPSYRAAQQGHSNFPAKIRNGPMGAGSGVDPPLARYRDEGSDARIGERMTERLTEEQAGEKWLCPLTGFQNHCVGSKCPKWQAGPFPRTEIITTENIGWNPRW